MSKIAKIIANQKKNARRLQKWYNNLNAYDLALTYVPSHRPKAGLLEEVIEDGRKVMIHCFRPSEQHDEQTGGEAFIIQNNVCQESQFDIPTLPLPVVFDEDEPRMKKYWRCIENGFKEEDFRVYQAEKHLKFHKLSKNIYKQGLRCAHPYIAIKGKRNLVKILNEKGYEVGNMYDCGQLVSDLEAAIGGVKVGFKDLKPVAGQVLEKVMVLNEICILFDDKARKRIVGKRKPSFDKGSVFLLEDFHYRFGG